MHTHSSLTRELEPEVAGGVSADHGHLTRSSLLHPKPRCKKSFPLAVPSTDLLCVGSVPVLYLSSAFHPQYQLQMPPFIAVLSRLSSLDMGQSLSSGSFPYPSPPKYPLNSAPQQCGSGVTAATAQTFKLTQAVAASLPRHQA